MDRTNLFDGINDAARRELATRSTLRHFTKDEVYRIYLPYRRSAGRRDPARAVSSPSVGKQAALAEELGTVREVLVRSLRELRESGLIVPAGRGRWSVADRDVPASLALDDRAT